MATSKAHKTEFEQAFAPTMRDTASYIADLSAQLGAMAEAQGLALIASLLKLVSVEAARTAQRS